MPKPITPLIVPLVVSAMVIIPFYLVAPLLSLSSALLILAYTFLLMGTTLLVIGIKIIPKYERVVIFRLGRIIGVFGPGIIIVDPILDRVYRVDMRAKTLELKLRDVSTLDTTVRSVEARVTYRVADPQKALRIVYYKKKLLREAEGIIRGELSQITLDKLLSEKSYVEKKIISKLNKILITRGLEILSVNLKKE